MSDRKRGTQRDTGEVMREAERKTVKAEAEMSKRVRERKRKREREEEEEREGV